MSSQKIQSYLKQATRLLMVAFLSLAVIVSSVSPALAVTNSSSRGEANLNEIQRRTDSAAYENPEDIRPERVGNEPDALNLVQGSADKDKMKNTGDTTNDTTGKEVVEDFLSKITGDK